jgi:hypothetical protein
MLGQDLDRLCCQEKFADVHFSVGPRKTIIPAHRAILASRSKILEAMVYPTFGEQESEDLQITLPDVDPAAFRAMLRAIYTDDAKVNEDIVSQCLDLARRFDLDVLKWSCAKYLKDGLTIANATFIFENSEKLLGDSSFALRFIEENAEQILSTRGFRNLSLASLKVILQSDRLSAEEWQIWNGLVGWAAAECKRQNKDASEENLKKVVEPVLNLIRFPTMELTEMITHVKPTGVLSEGQMLVLFTYLGAKGSVSKELEESLPYPTKPRDGCVKRWTLDAKRKSGQITLSENKTQASNRGSFYSFILGDVGFTKGTHAWRVTITELPASMQWILLGVSARKTFTDNNSYSDTTLYGITSAKNVYRAGVAGNNALSFKQGDFVDCLLDLNKNIFQLRASSWSSNTVVPVAPVASIGGTYTPHFILYQNNAINVVPITPSRFGKFR